ncbi:MAG: radical SAM protein [archaeon]
MKKILLVYLPFCTPATPPYSITYLHSFLKSNCSADTSVDVLDLNIAFHVLNFPEFQQYFRDQKQWDTYEKITEEYLRKSAKTYSSNNSRVVKGGKPEFFEELLERIISRKPDVVAFSIVYSSQAFFARTMLQILKKSGIVTVIGGPSVNDKLIALAGHSFSTEIEFLEFIHGKKLHHGQLDFRSIPDFSIWNLKEYFTPYPVIPLRLTSTCYYQKCAFCSHYARIPYHEYDLEIIKKTIIQSAQKHFYLIDDMIPRRRLLQFAEVIKPLGCYWACQLRPTNDLDYDALKTLQESGLVLILWGIESGNRRILKLIEKGTNPEDISAVLKNAYKAGISNVTFTMFGFPTETKEEFMETISFLEDNKRYIDLVSPALFGLQRGTPVFKNPEKYNIVKIIEEERTVLEPKLIYEVSAGLTQKEAIRLKSQNRKRIGMIGRFPKSMNFFREHMVCLLANRRRAAKQ